MIVFEVLAQYLYSILTLEYLYLHAVIAPIVPTSAYSAYERLQVPIAPTSAYERL